MPPKKQKESDSSSRISDARFAKFESDPRYRLPSRRDTKTKLDKRFGRVLKDKEFTATTQIDRYGRKLKTDKKKKALERLYEMDDEEDDEEGEDDSEDEPASTGKSRTTLRDAARGGGFSASESEDSDDDDDDDASLEEEAENDEDEDAVDTQQFRQEEAEVPTGEVTHRVAIVNLDWDHVKSRDLMALFSSFVPKDGRGRIVKISVYPSQFGRERMQREELEGPPREIFKDTKEDDEDDESQDSESDGSESSDEDDEAVKKDLLREENDQDFDSNALRSYQLDRLRYYYAVMVCSDTATAEAIYRATDGSEYQSSSNFVDLRFVPDDVSFDDDEPRDECTEVPSNYKPVEFVTQALQHSKVKLTWDMHPDDTSRKDLMKKAFSGTPAELIENDLRAYLASDSDGDDESDEFNGLDDVKVEAMAEAAEEQEDGNKQGPEKPLKLSKKEQARQKMRAALGLSEEPTSKSASSGSKHGPVGGMQITFTPALTDGPAAAKKVAADGAEETTLEKYKRKEKERKEKRKQKAIAKREGRDVDAEDEDEDQLAEKIMEGDDGAAAGEDDLGFDDPFFTSEDPAGLTAAGGASKSSVRKEERLKKRAAREAEEREKEKSRAQLQALMGGEDADLNGASGHFDLREVIKAEKQRQKEERKKNRRNHNRQGHGDDEGETGLDSGAVASAHGVDVSDPRLQAVLSGAEFAIDPSNPQYKDTLGLQQMQTEARRKRKTAVGGDADKDTAKTAKKPKTTTASRNDELANLVRSVKSKVKKSVI
ncbi:pre-rRNA-processing protein esf1 [Sporothrix epigloea]|uniref:Pre-rRNA-processing protein esf1 n=1 Tax=Sporothrix epigloea TaxID=1892477 RepID=A0ABP0E2C8_9PEZI